MACLSLLFGPAWPTCECNYPQGNFSRCFVRYTQIEHQTLLRFVFEGKYERIFWFSIEYFSGTLVSAEVEFIYVSFIHRTVHRRQWSVHGAIDFFFVSSCIVRWSHKNHGLFVSICSAAISLHGHHANQSETESGKINNEWNHTLSDHWNSSCLLKIVVFIIGNYFMEP